MTSNEAFSQLVSRVMFDYESYEEDRFASECSALPPKLLRWLATHHPDNKSRKTLLRLTSVCIGDGAVINAGIVISDDYKPLLTIGARVAVSPNVLVICASSPNNSELLNGRGFRERYVKSLPVLIDDDSWIGAGAIILPGVRIGKRCIVGAGAVVNCDVLDGSVVVGCPARRIGSADG